VVIWTDFALKQLDLIYTYHRSFSEKTAQKIVSQLLTSADRLQKHPLMGPKEELLQSSSSSYRYIISGNYKIIYKIAQGVVFIIDVFDTRQNPVKIRINK
jgi:toxin ParE1/3/4